MRKFSAPKRKEETFEQWKLRKDREASLSLAVTGRRSDLPSSSPRKGRSFDLSKAAVVPQANNGESIKAKQKDDDVFTKDRLKAIIRKEEHEIRKRFQTGCDGPNTSDSNLKLTFHEWLHKKELEEKERKKRAESRKMELEEIERMKKEMSKRAVDEWMIRTKYRTYAKYFPNMNDDSVNQALLDYMRSSTSE